MFKQIMLNNACVRIDNPLVFALVNKDCKIILYMYNCGWVSPLHFLVQPCISQALQFLSLISWSFLPFVCRSFETVFFFLFNIHLPLAIFYTSSGVSLSWEQSQILLAFLIQKEAGGLNLLWNWAHFCMDFF